METNRTRNLFFGAIIIVLLVAGGLWAASNIYFGSDAPETTDVCVTPESGRYEGMEVCGSQEMLLGMGLIEREAEIITVMVDGVTLSGMSNNVDNLLATPTPALMQNRTVAPVEVTEVDSEYTYVSVSGVPTFITLSDHFPTRAYPVRWGNGVIQANSNPFNAMASVVAEPGVLSADDLDDCEGNDSCVLSSVNLERMDNTESFVLCPAGGYIKVTGSTYTIDGLISIEPQPMVTHATLIRCPYDDSDADDNNRLHITTSEPGSVQFIAYPVLPEAGGFFSWNHLLEDLVASQSAGTHNCGTQGCNQTYLEIIDVNHDLLQVWDFNGSSVNNFDLDLLASNAVQPSR
jgi:hypothetical protein